MITYGVWLVAGKDLNYPLGSWCTGSGIFKQNGNVFKSDDINFSYRFRENMSIFNRVLGLDAYEVKEYTH